MSYYLWSSFRRKKLDQLQEKYRGIYRGIVLDMGGRDRGKFKKPKDKVEKWIFADIEEKHHPDIVLDIADMRVIENNSIDVIAAVEVFAHVEKIDKALDECHRILKNGGEIIFSVPLMYPIINDPTDFQRWTEAKWRKELTKRGFKVETVEVVGLYFTLLAEILNLGNKSCPKLKYLGFVFYPILSLLAKLDNTKIVQKNKTLSSFTTGYMIIAKK